jgi:hypothetical protein
MDKKDNDAQIPGLGEDNPQDPEFWFAPKALLSAYEPMLTEELELTKSPGKFREAVLTNENLGSVGRLQGVSLKRNHLSCRSRNSPGGCARNWSICPEELSLSPHF